uniref:Uncharacterized protein n=1 Tax=Oryza glumipatula TaxID=40148 RepID=A0A0E0AZN6_9ORYZ
MEEEKGMMGKQEKKMLLQAAYDGNLRLSGSPLSGHRVFPNKNLLEEHLLLHQLGTSVCCTKNVIVIFFWVVF